MKWTCRNLGLLMCLLSTGCGTSKWAMDNLAYSEKYDRPYSNNRSDKWLRMTKQMVDARHVRRQDGTYVSFGASDFGNDQVLGGEIGYLGYSRSWLSGKIGVLGLYHSETDPSWLLGANTGLQISTPTRLAPYVGVGGFMGAGTRGDGRGSNHYDDDFDGMVDEDDEEGIEKASFLAAVYPEAGVSYWINGRTRLHAGASYWFNTLGRDHDFWYYGVGLTFQFGPVSKSGAVLDERIHSEEDAWLDRLPRDWKPSDDSPPAEATSVERSDQAAEATIEP